MMIPVRSYLQLLARHLRPQGGRVAVLAALVAASIALQLAGPQLVKTFIDRAVAGRPAGELVRIAGVFIGLTVTHQGVAVGAAYLAETIGWTATNRLRAELTAHVLALDLGFHERHPPGALIERIDGDVSALSNFFSAMILEIVGNGALVTGIVVLVWLETPAVGIGLVALVVVGGLVSGHLHRIAVPWWRRVRASSAEFFGVVAEQAEGTEDVVANGAADFMLGRLAALLRRWLPETIRGWSGWALLWSASVILYVTSLVLTFVFGWRLFGIGALGVGSVYLLLQYVQMMHHPIEEMREQLVDLQKAGASIDRVAALLATEPDLRVAGNRRLPDGPLAVEFDAVTFSYDGDGRDVTLHDVSFILAPGRVLGLLGRTGSGKSTIARLVTRLYDPRRGEVRIGGVPTWELAVTELRRRVGMVTQDVQIFRATVRDNLTLFDPAVPDARLVEAIGGLGLDGWLAGLPEGLDTIVGPDDLSAGQAQLLAFTRVFLLDPGVVVLDEASSRLDPATERLIERAVDHLLTGRTGIVIAHHLATVERADDICIVEEGRIVEFGARAALVADPRSRLSRLLETGMEEVLR
ncbi:MAG TPA: ABC transporter ATP-binding protein [Actinobacteria bacterium]|nr:ABC transporter ATP-binding protein [Actinomycetota bacterium]